METIVVRVRDKSYEITVEQKSKTVWIASGEYMGEPIQVKGTGARDGCRTMARSSDTTEVISIAARLDKRAQRARLRLMSKPRKKAA